MTEPVITRFAPSPTGHLHVGGARTALFNWALARATGGTFLLRIEDTDRARSSDEAVRGLLDDLAWLGIDWDEGPEHDFECGGERRVVGGDPRGVGPFFQRERLAHYDAHLERLIAADLAYPAFDSPDELEALRRRARERGEGFRYRRPDDWDRDAALRRMRNEPHVVRLRTPREAVRVADAVLGEVDFDPDQVDDFVLRKRDGFPTYHFASVVDDEAMGITCVLRGQEHLNNTPRHIALQRALGFRTPAYAHLPLIFNPDGSKMSKRDKDKAARAAVREALARDPGTARARVLGAVGADRLDAWLADKRSQLDTGALVQLSGALELDLPGIDVEDFRRDGYLPEVLCNFLALLGWSTGVKDAEGRDLERFDRALLAERFSTERIGRSNARFDRDKLLAFDQETLASLDDAAFLAGWRRWAERYAPELFAGWPEERLGWLARALRTRCATFAEAASPRGPGAFAFAADDGYAFDPKAVAKFLHKGDPPGHALLAEAAPRLAALEPFTPDAIEKTVRELADEWGVGLGKLAQPLRVAVTGSAASPPLGETLAILGPDAVKRRIERCLAECRPAGS